jgi:hypothetical protein
MTIKAIEKFLQNWRANALKVYTEEAAKYSGIRSELRSLEDAAGDRAVKRVMGWYRSHLALWHSPSGNYRYDHRTKTCVDIPKPKPSDLLIASSPRFVELCNELNDYIKSNTDTFMHIITEKMGEIDTLLDKEVDRKREALITRVEKKAGRIVDASGLRVGDDGEINGRIKGEENTVNINTITAGGYNIQCLHYRLLVKVIK